MNAVPNVCTWAQESKSRPNLMYTEETATGWFVPCYVIGNRLRVLPTVGLKHSTASHGRVSLFEQTRWHFLTCACAVGFEDSVSGVSNEY